MQFIYSLATGRPVFLTARSRITLFLAIPALLVSLSAGNPTTQLSDAELKVAAKRQADQCIYAMTMGDYDTFASKTYPKVLEMAGGKDNLSRTIAGIVADMKSHGISPRSNTLSEVTQINESNSKIYAVLPEATEFSVSRGPSQGTWKSESYLLGISEDGGQSWTFVDGAGIARQPELLHAILPDFPPEIQLPKRKDPVLIPSTLPATEPTTRNDGADH